MNTRRYAAGAAIATLATIGLAAPAAAAGTGGYPPPPTVSPVITVTTPASGPFAISSTSHRAGQVRFHFISHAPEGANGGGSDDVLVGLRNGVTIGQVEAHIALQNEPPTKPGLAKAAASTRWLVANTHIYGGAAIQGIGTANTTAFLPAGTVYLLDTNGVFSGAKPVPVKAIHIYGPVPHQLLPAIAGTVSVASADTFKVTSTALARGNYLIRNISDTIHFVDFSPVKPGTTDAEMTKVANAELNGANPGTDPYLHNKTGVEADVVSPGQQEVFSSALITPGTYDLECYIADDVTGMPHFFMGMHKIIVIK
jgi:hypothetical protein